MLIRICLILLMGWVMTLGLYAQGVPETDPAPRLRHELGFAAGSTIGYGPAYKIRYRRWAGLVAFAPQVRTGREQYMAGLSFQYILQTTPVSHFFLYQGNRMITNTKYNYYYFWTSPISSNPWGRETLKEFLFSHSLGLGYEMFSRPEKKNPLGLSFMAGWAVYDNFRSGTFSVEMSVLYKFRRD